MKYYASFILRTVGNHCCRRIVLLVIIVLDNNFKFAWWYIQISNYWQHNWVFLRRVKKTSFFVQCTSLTYVRHVFSRRCCTVCFLFVQFLFIFLQPFRSFPRRDGEETDYTNFLPRYGAETDLYVFLSPHGDKMKSGVYSWIFYEIKQPSLERRWSTSFLIDATTVSSTNELPTMLWCLPWSQFRT